MPTITHVLKFLQIFASTFLLINLLHVFSLLVSQFFFGDGLFVFITNGHFVMDVHIIFDVPFLGLCFIVNGKVQASRRVREEINSCKRKREREGEKKRKVSFMPSRVEHQLVRTVCKVFRKV